MTRIVTDPYALDEPLSPHALSHVLSDLISTFVPTDEEEAEESMVQAGYRPKEIAQAMDAWRAHWAEVIECSTCGSPATHLWASLSEDGVPSSMNGPWAFTPSCDECSGNSFDDGAGRPVIRAPLGMPSAIPHPPTQYDEHARADRATITDITRVLDEFDAETAVSQVALDDILKRPLLLRVVNHVSFTHSLMLDLARINRAVREANTSAS